MSLLKYLIRCSTVGGVTGHRESVVKSMGDVMKFVTESEASHEALRLNMQASLHTGPAIMKYWPDTIENAQKEGYL